MTEAPHVASVAPEDTLEAARSVLRAEGVSGLPVLRADGTVAGVLSRKDLRPLWKRRGHRETFATTPVSEVVSALTGLVYRAASALRLPLDGRSMDALLAARRL